MKKNHVHTLGLNKVIEKGPTLVIVKGFTTVV